MCSQLKNLTLSVVEFIRSFSLHILPSELMRIRHCYGSDACRFLKVFFVLGVGSFLTS
jgi:hypothetical protein